KEMFGDTMCYLDGLLIALFLPVGTPLYVVVIAVVFANYIVRNGFGGFTYNLFNVAAVGAVFATLSWKLTAIFDSNLINIILESTFGLPKIVTETIGNSVAHVNSTYNYLLLGNPQTTLGYIPAFIIILIGLFLMIKKVIDYKIVITLFISTIVIGYFVNTGLNIDDYIIKNIFIGTFLLGTVFIAADPTVVPNSTFGKIFYSIIVIFIMFVMRELGIILDGFIFAVLFGNLLTPFINAKSATMSIKKQCITGVFIVIIIIAGAIGIGNVASQKEPVENTLQWYNPTFVKPISESVIQGGVIDEWLY
ncbi:MAG: RnfABCDGE type electron transport complex subunit D, partial [Mycoplasmatales bacterium]